MAPARLTLFLLLSVLVHGQEPTHLLEKPNFLQTHPASSKDAEDAIEFGIRWHIYVRATVYHLLIFKLYENDAALAFWHTSLVEFARRIPRVTQDINPCRRETFVVGRLGLDNVDSLLKSLDLFEEDVTRHNSRWCGIAQAVYAPHLAEDYHMSKSNTEYKWQWVLHANEAFIFNITFLSFEVHTHAARSSLRLSVEEYGFNNSGNVASQFKTGYFQWSYYSNTNTVVVVFGAENPHALEFNENWKESYQAKFSFQYQIHDNDFSFVRQRDVFLFNRLHSGLQGSHDGVFMNTELYGMRINAPWGRTVLLDWGKFTCQSLEGEIRIIFYDLPEMVLSRTLSKFEQLGEWSCSNYHSGDRKSIQATIGDLTAVVLLKRGASFSKKDFSLDYNYTQLSASVSTTDNITLQPLESRAAFLPARLGKHIHFLYVASTADAFLRVSIQSLLYSGYTSHQCIFGGLMLYSKYHLIDRVCSNITGEYLTKHFHAGGITIGRRLVLIAKQYGWLSQISAALILHLQNCSGFVNALPYFMFSRSGTLPRSKFYGSRRGGIMRDEIAATWRTYNRKFSHYYSLSSVYQKDIYVLHFYREKSLCYKFQIVSFDIFGLLELPYMRNSSRWFLEDAIYYFGSHENGFASRFQIRFSFTSDEIQHSDPCMYDGLRYFPNNRNDEPYTFLHPSRTWSIQSHFAVVRAKWMCIKFGSAISIQVEDGIVSAACLRELGAYMPMHLSEISTPGTCGHLLIRKHIYKSWANSVAFMLQRPSRHSKCCFYEGVISADNYSCLYSVSLFRQEIVPVGKRHIQRLSGLLWDVQRYTEKLVRWRELCWRNKFGFLNVYCFVLGIKLRPKASCKLRFSYRAHLLNRVFDNNTNVKGTKYNRMCLDSTCYVAPVTPQNVAWKRTREICKQKGGDLASINSAREWKFITSQYKDHIGFLNVYKALVFFIGLRSEVSLI